MIFLFAFILIGFLLAKFNIVQKNAAGILAKLENWIFIPALVLQTFMENFTVANLGVTWKLLAFGCAINVLVFPISILISKMVAKDRYTRNICIYTLCFSNFGFMGNAVVGAIFHDILYEYIVFTLTLWVPIYVWGVPVLLSSDGAKKTFSQRLKAFVNPMFIEMLIGMVLGITGLGTKLPTSIDSVISVSASCMSPVAMLLTGITVAGIDFKKTLKLASIYYVSIIRLLAYPLAALGIFALLRPLNIPDNYVICAICALAMPTGLNTVVIPAAQDKDTSFASGMALLSHLSSIITIPLIFMLLRIVIK